MNNNQTIEHYAEVFYLAAMRDIGEETPKPFCDMPNLYKVPYINAALAYITNMDLIGRETAR